MLNEQAWAGSTANTYIAKAVLEDKLGCQVEITKIAELPGDVSSVTDQIQQMFEASNILGAPSRAATRMIVVAARSAAQAFRAEGRRRR